MKVLLLPPVVLFVAVLILSFVARLSLPTKTDPCHLLHIPATVDLTVRSLKTKTFVTLHCPNEVLLLPEILLRHGQIFSFLFDSIKSILDHCKGQSVDSDQSNQLAL